MFAGSQYDRHELELHAGDSVLFASDGLIEAHDADGEQFGVERITEVCEANRREPADELLACILEAVEAHTGEMCPHDDMTALLLRAR
jgi:serine phosphatase RsbU (regulator of sigma subunit)